MKPSETGALISALGIVVIFMFCLFHPLNDWRIGELKSTSHYLGMFLFLLAPFLIAFLFFAYRVHKTR